MQERKAKEDQSSFRCAYSGNSLQITNFVISEPLQKQIVPFTLEKCVIHIIWQIKPKMNSLSSFYMVAFHCYAFAQAECFKTNAPDLLTLMLLLCYEVTELRCFKRNSCRHNFGAESTRRLSTWVSSMEERKYWKLHFSYPLLTWVTLTLWVAGTLGVISFVPYLWGHTFCSISLGSYLLFCWVQHSKSEPCWENASRLWGHRGESCGKAVKDTEYRSILLNVLLLEKPMTVKMQPMLSVSLANPLSKELFIQVPSLVLQTGEASKETLWIKLTN